MNWFQKYFIPHEDNEYKPHLLRNEIAFALLALILPNTLVDETNQSRAAINLPPLTESPLLVAAAQQKANDMAVNGYFAHTSPAGVTPWYWFQNVGYKYTHAGENLAVNFSDSNDVIRAWLNSPTHKANIINGDYTQIGIATAQGTYEGQRTVFVVQLFGRPPAPKPAPAPVTATAPQIEEPEPVADPVEVVPQTQIASNQFNRVAVEGANIETDIPGASQPVTQPAAAPADELEIAPAAAPTPIADDAASKANAGSSANFIQRLFAAPRLTANMIYLVLAILVILALILNIAVKMRVQHPQLVLNGIMILLTIGTLAIFNHQLLLANAQIF